MAEEKSEGELSDSEEEEVKPPPRKKAKEVLLPGKKMSKRLMKKTMKKLIRRSKAKAIKKQRKAKREKKAGHDQRKQEVTVQNPSMQELVKQEQAIRELAREEGRLEKLKFIEPASSDYRAMLAELTTLLPSSSSSSSSTNSSTTTSPAPEELSPESMATANHLSFGECEECLPAFKTEVLQEAILHLLLGDDLSPDLVELRSRRIAVLWLSMVSAEIFLTYSEELCGLHSLSPSVQLLLRHPGTDTSAKLGLETLMFKSERGRGGGGGECLTKQSYLLNVEEMNENDYPLPKLLQAQYNTQDTSDYIILAGEWVAEPLPDNSCPMFAVDCEMVLTNEGYELARVSVVNDSLTCIYDKLVKPDNQVLDYKTKYSGVTEEILKNVTTSLSDVQRDLTALLPQRCILLGHSLENDLRALKMLHPFVIDTSCLFQPPRGAVAHWFKPKLQMLAKRFLGKEIQMGRSGHSPQEDAQTCMELVLKKLKLGDKMSLYKIDRSILTELANHGRPTAIVDRSGVVKLFGGLATHHVVSRDDEVMEEASEAIWSHHLTFVQLHSYEDFVKGHPKHRPEHMKQRVLRQLDSEATEIVASCPPGTLALVVCGSNDITRMKGLLKLNLWDQVKEIVATARTGLALAFIT